MFIFAYEALVLNESFIDYLPNTITSVNNFLTPDQIRTTHRMVTLYCANHPHKLTD
jgi:hypothetical protein